MSLVEIELVYITLTTDYLDVCYTPIGRFIQVPDSSISSALAHQNNCLFFPKKHHRLRLEGLLGKLENLVRVLGLGDLPV